MTTKSQRIRMAVKLYEDFTGDIGGIASEKLEWKAGEEDVLVIIGQCEAIAYRATRDGETQSYQHEFSENAQPALAVSHDGLRLYLLAGAYKFTSHGIEDR